MGSDVGSLEDELSLRKEPTSVSKRVSPAEWLRVQIDEVFVGGHDLRNGIVKLSEVGAVANHISLMRHI
jgi:hypothetical protein